MEEKYYSSSSRSRSSFRALANLFALRSFLFNFLFFALVSLFPGSTIPSAINLSKFLTFGFRFSPWSRFFRVLRYLRRLTCPNFSLSVSVSYSRLALIFLCSLRLFFLVVPFPLERRILLFGPWLRARRRITSRR